MDTQVIFSTIDRPVLRSQLGVAKPRISRPPSAVVLGGSVLWRVVVNTPEQKRRNSNSHSEMVLGRRCFPFWEK